MCARGNAWKSLVSMPSRTPREIVSKRERERERIYGCACMCVRVEGWGWSIRPWGRDSRVGGLPILPAGVFASATFQSSPQPPFPDHAILLPLSFLLFSVCVSLLFSVNFSPFLPLSFPISLLSLLALSRARARSRSRSPCHALSIYPARSGISPSDSPPTQRVPAATDTPPPPVQPASVPRSSSSFHPLCLPVTPPRCHSHAAGNRADPA